MDIDDNLNQTAPVSPSVVPPVVQTSQTPPISSEPKKGLKMKMMGALTIAIVILVVLGVFGYSYFKASSVKTQEATSANNLNKNNSNQVRQGTGSKKTTDTGDSQLNKDLQSVDESLNNTDKNAAAVDQGLNDQQTNLQ